MREIAWDNARRVASNFSSMQQLQTLFAAVHLPLQLALSSVRQLSLGERHRATIARQLDH